MVAVLPLGLNADHVAALKVQTHDEYNALNKQTTDSHQVVGIYERPSGSLVSWLEDIMLNQQSHEHMFFDYTKLPPEWQRVPIVENTDWKRAMKEYISGLSDDQIKALRKTVQGTR